MVERESTGAHAIAGPRGRQVGSARGEWGWLLEERMLDRAVSMWAGPRGLRGEGALGWEGGFWDSSGEKERGVAGWAKKEERVGRAGGLGKLLSLFYFKPTQT